MNEDDNCALWLGVLDRALIDATANPDRVQTIRHEQLHARKWLLGDSADFRRVCEFANVQPDQVRKSAAPLIAKAKQRDREQGDRERPNVVQPRTMLTYEFNGRSLSVAAWSAVTGLGQQIIYSRIRQGWNVEAALTRPVKGQRQQQTPGVGRSLVEDASDRSTSVTQDCL